MLDLLEREARALGFETRRQAWTDAGGVEKGNLVCRRGPEAGGGLALVGHTDCVPFDPAWAEALAGAERDGRVIGRGRGRHEGLPRRGARRRVAHARRASRPLIAALHRRRGDGLPRREAAPRRGARPPAPRDRGRADVAHARCARTRATARSRWCSTGVEGHSAYPDVGASAIHAAGRLFPELEKIGEALRGETDAAFSPPHTTWNVGVIQGGKARNIIAGECRFTYEWRPIPGRIRARRSASSRRPARGSRRRAAAGCRCR